MTWSSIKCVLWHSSSFRCWIITGNHKMSSLWTSNVSTAVSLLVFAIAEVMMSSLFAVYPSDNRMVNLWLTETPAHNWYPKMEYRYKMYEFNLYLNHNLSFPSDSDFLLCSPNVKDVISLLFWWGEWSSNSICCHKFRDVDLKRICPSKAGGLLTEVKLEQLEKWWIHTFAVYPSDFKVVKLWLLNCQLGLITTLTEVSKTFFSSNVR